MIATGASFWLSSVMNMPYVFEVPITLLATVFLAAFGDMFGHFPRVVPRQWVKNGLDRFVVMNHAAKSIVESCRGHHPERVYIRDGEPVIRIYNSGWKAARRRATKQSTEELNRPCRAGFRRLRVHEPKHIFGHRPRAAGGGFEDRQFLRGY